jgi:hypothetical protein
MTQKTFRQVEELFYNFMVYEDLKLLQQLFYDHEIIDELLNDEIKFRDELVNLGQQPDAPLSLDFDAPCQIRSDVPMGLLTWLLGPFSRQTRRWGRA